MRRTNKNPKPKQNEHKPAKRETRNEPTCRKPENASSKRHRREKTATKSEEEGEQFYNFLERESKVR